jgi:hypothetical protein
MAKYFWQVPTNKTAASLDRMTEAIKDFSESQEVISKAEIKSKDRVDIPLSEYLEMRERISIQDSKLRSLYCTVKRLGIPLEVIDSIVPDSIEVYRNEDVKDFITHYMIKFDVDASLDILRRSYR